MNYGLNTSMLRFYVNYLGRYKISKYADRSVTNLTSKFFISPKFFRWLRPQLKFSYDHTANHVTQYGLTLNKRIFGRGQLTLSFERQEITKSFQAAIALKFWNSFADFTSRLINSDGYTSMSQIQSGSIRFDQDARQLFFDRRNSIGYGAAVIRPFMDENYNGILNDGEEYISGLKASIKGGRQKRFGEDLYYYDGLRPYDPYIVHIDKNSLNNPLLKPPYENYEVFCNPNIITTINVPLVTSSDISGQVSRQVGDMKTGQGGIKLMILNMSNESITEITTFSNGQFYYLGLVSGLHRIYIDPEQLEKYGYGSQPYGIEFEVEMGTSIEDINLLLIPVK